MFLNRFFVVLLFFWSIVFFGQEGKVKKDSIENENLNEVVITGQLQPQSIKKSVFEVKVIKKEEIKQLAANNLADVLNQTLNMSIYPSSTNGKSQINVLGLGGRYFKVLIDNIPIVNEEGFGNNTDLTTINLDDIERIEIVEGAMGVQYGAYALSGILNIITKKKSKSKWNIDAFVQEETIGKEYEFFNEGRHIQSVSIGHKLTDKNYINISLNRNDFRGYLDSLKGKRHNLKDNYRGYIWLPKKQINPKLLFSHYGDKFSSFYKFDYLNETIFFFNRNVELNNNPVFDINDPSALDIEFTNNRFMHHLNFNGYINKLNYDVSFSFQKQEKKRDKFTYKIEKDLRENSEEEIFLDKEVWFSRGTLNNILKSPKFSMQAGYEFTDESGYGSSIATVGNLADNNFRNSIRSFDLFTSGEIKINENFSAKPGIRASFTNSFGTQMYYSASLRHLFKNDWEARAVLGFGATTPTYDQLYTYFVDVNHNIQGNPDLDMETGLSTFFHLKKHTSFTDNFRMKNKLTLSFIDVKDRIELILVNQTPPEFKYNNIDEFTSIGASLENSFWISDLTLNLGASFFGISKLIEDTQNNTQRTRSQNFYTHQVNANLGYVIPNLDTTISAYVKYVGNTNRFVVAGGAYQIQTIDAYSLVDVSARKSFLDKKIEATLGVRNLFDITNVATNGISGGAHSGTINSISLGYGRSYFLKLAYNIKI